MAELKRSEILDMTPAAPAAPTKTTKTTTTMKGSSTNNKYPNYMYQVAQI